MGAALTAALNTFQSTPAIAGRRILVHHFSASDFLVSIHSGHCWPENRRNRRPVSRSAKFQSTPAIAGRRIYRLDGTGVAPSRFQSTPAIAGRRICQRFHFRVIVQFQSTPAIAGRRIRLVAQCLRNRQISFNPLRPLLAGESSLSHVGAPNKWFQSTPAIAGRRIRWRIRGRGRDRSFNPLRPLLAGESTEICRISGLTPVSIHSGHCWPENPWFATSRPPSSTFQSTPAIAGRRISYKHPPRGDERRFNPLRPLLAGESRAGHSCGRRGDGFNPLRPLLAGESRRPSAARSGSRFNPLRPLLAGESTGLMGPWWPRRGFNPLRPLLAGESRRGWNPGRKAKVFQSTPAIAGRRIRVQNRLDVEVAVSIHSGHCWPENLGLDLQILHHAVSIHSGHCWPENLVHAALGADVLVSIHSGHCWPENQTMSCSESVLFMFQSTPAIAGRRIAAS